MNKVIVLVALLATGLVPSVASSAPDDNTKNADNGIVLVLEATEQEYDPVKPSKAALRCIVRNQSARSVVVPFGRESLTITSGGLTLIRRAKEPPQALPVNAARPSVSVEPNKEHLLFEVRLDEILRKGKEQAGEWYWNWERRPEPPLSPIHNWREPGFQPGASFRAVLDAHELGELRSNEVVVFVTKEPGKRQLPVYVHVKPLHSSVKTGNPISLTVTIWNGLKRDIAFHGYHSPHAAAWNGETASFHLVDIYRDGQQEALFQAAPKVERPPQIAGESRITIAPGANHMLQTDARKWTIKGSWTPGRYRVIARVDRLELDPFSSGSVLSEPFELEVTE